MNTQLVAAFFVKSAGHRRMRGVPNSIEQTRKLSVQSGDPRLPPLVVVIFQGYLSPLSCDQIRKPRLICFKAFRQVMRLALALARASAGSRRPAKIAMMAMTTSNSISVNAENFNLKFIDQSGESVWSGGGPIHWISIKRKEHLSNQTCPELARNSQTNSTSSSSVST